MFLLFTMKNLESFTDFWNNYTCQNFNDIKLWEIVIIDQFAFSKILSFYFDIWKLYINSRLNYYLFIFFIAGWLLVVNILILIYIISQRQIIIVCIQKYFQSVYYNPSINFNNLITVNPILSSFLKFISYKLICVQFSVIIIWLIPL